MINVVSLTNVAKVYKMGEATVTALRGVNLKISRGQFVAIMGPSGSGKSTLMHIIGLLDRPSSGQVFLEGRQASTLSEDEAAGLRNRHIGFVFQNFNLLPRTTALANVELPLIYARLPREKRLLLARQALLNVGLGNRLSHLPTQLSGGEQQRVAIARAIVTNPSLILADEPTGNLDSASGKEILELLKSINQGGNTVVLVTHDPKIASFAERIIEIEDGKIIRDIKK